MRGPQDRPARRRRALFSLALVAILLVAGTAYATSMSIQLPCGGAGATYTNRTGASGLCGYKVTSIGGAGQTFTVTANQTADMDVYFYASDGDPTQAFTTTSTSAQTGSVPGGSSYAIVVVASHPSALAPVNVSFTYVHS